MGESGARLRWHVYNLDMIPGFKKYGQIYIALVGAVVIIATALLTQGTEHNDTGWFYAFCLWLFAFSVFEVYSAKKGKDL